MQHTPRRLTVLLLTGSLAVAGAVSVALPAAAAPAELEVCATCDYTTIQSAVNAASDGDTVVVAPGTYTGAVTVSKGIVLRGAGSGTDPATSTIISGTGTGDGLTLTSSDSAQVTVEDLRVTGFANGIRVNGSDVLLDGVAGSDNGVYGIILADGVTRLEIRDSEFNGNGAGLKVASKDSASYLTITGSHFDDNRSQGWYSDKNATSGSTIEHVTITDSTFNNNPDKGFYTEKLSHAVFDNVQFNNSGNDRAQQGAGLDLNLKYGEYEDIVLSDVQAIGSGSPSTPNGSGIAIAARNDGATYGANPAELSDVNIVGGRITGAVNGLYVGFAIADEVVVADVDLAGNEIAIKNETDDAVVSATRNWWGSAVPDFAALTVGDVITSPWYEDAAMTVLRAHVDPTDPVLPVPDAGKIHIVVPDGVEEPRLDVSELQDEDGSFTVLDGLSVDTAGGASLAIPAGTKVTPSDPEWGSEFIPPVVVEVETVTLPNGSEVEVAIAIEVGSTEVAFTLDRAARLVLPGAAGSRVGFSEPGGEFTLVTTECAADSREAGDAVQRDCFIDAGDDLVVWTKHFSTFAAFGVAAMPATGVEGAAGGMLAAGLVLVGIVAVGIAVRRRSAPIA